VLVLNFALAIIIFLVTLLCVAIFNLGLFSNLILFFIFFRVVLIGGGVMKNWYHVIILMMLLEAAMLQAFFLLSYFTTLDCSVRLLFMFSALMVIEASLGISVLTLISRSHGNDYVLVF
jgi:hypothetical protein